MKHIHRKPFHWPTVIYNTVWTAGFCWFMYWGYRTAADNVRYWDGVPYIITAIVPSIAIWVWKRLYTGKWIG